MQQCSDLQVASQMRSSSSSSAGAEAEGVAESREESGAASCLCESRRRAVQLRAEAPVCVESLRAQLVAAFATHAHMPSRRKRRGR